MDRSRIAIIIPALNEAATIVGVISSVGNYGVPVVVDDGSSDATGMLATAAGAVVVTHDVNRGYDAALNSGFRKAKELGCEVMVTVDADGQHDPSRIVLFLDALSAGADVVVGIRSRQQRSAERLFAWVAKRRHGILDPLCGMKAYRRSVYEALGYFDSYASIGTQLTIFAAKNGFAIAQIPVAVRDREDESRFGRTLSGNARILRAMLLSLWCVPVLPRV